MNEGHKRRTKRRNLDFLHVDPILQNGGQPPPVVIAHDFLLLVKEESLRNCVRHSNSSTVPIIDFTALQRDSLINPNRNDVMESWATRKHRSSFETEIFYKSGLKVEHWHNG
jgi:hypothetical protein